MGAKSRRPAVITPFKSDQPADDERHDQPQHNVNIDAVGKYALIHPSFGSVNRVWDSTILHGSLVFETTMHPFVAAVITRLLIRAQQGGLVSLHPTHPAAPMAVYRRLSRRHIVQSSTRNDETLAVARAMRHRTVAVAANLPRETLRLRQIVPLDQVLALRPAKLVGIHRDIRRPYTARGFAATRTITVAESQKRRRHLIVNRFAKTTSMKHGFSHRFLSLEFQYAA